MGIGGRGALAGVGNSRPRQSKIHYLQFTNLRTRQFAYLRICKFANGVGRMRNPREGKTASSREVELQVWVWKMEGHGERWKLSGRQGTMDGIQMLGRGVDVPSCRNVACSAGREIGRRGMEDDSGGERGWATGA